MGWTRGNCTELERFTDNSCTYANSLKVFGGPMPILNNIYKSRVYIRIWGHRGNLKNK
jgi:hypothetical protein